MQLPTQRQLRGRNVSACLQNAAACAGIMLSGLSCDVGCASGSPHAAVCMAMSMLRSYCSTILKVRCWVSIQYWLACALTKQLLWRRPHSPLRVSGCSSGDSLEICSAILAESCEKLWTVVESESRAHIYVIRTSTMLQARAPHLIAVNLTAGRLAAAG